jgi:hypothetical protein
MIFVGDDWAEDHHDIHVMDAGGHDWRRAACPKGSRASAGSTSWWVPTPRIPARW